MDALARTPGTQAAAHAQALLSANPSATSTHRRHIPPQILLDIPKGDRFPGTLNERTLCVAHVLTSAEVTKCGDGPSTTTYHPNAHVLKSSHYPWIGPSWADHGLHIRRLAGIQDEQCRPCLGKDETAAQPTGLQIEYLPPSSPDVLNRAFSAHAATSPGHISVATDGAILNHLGRHVAAAGFAIIKGGEIQEVHTYVLGASRCAYDAEVAGLSRAICHIASIPDVTSTLLITDCQSALRKLSSWAGFDQAEAELAAAISEYCTAPTPRALRLAFSPGHAGVLANEFVDSAIPIMVRLSLASTPPFTPWALPASRQAVKSAVKRKLENDETTVLGQLSRECDSKSAPVLLATGADRSRIGEWMQALRHNRAAQCLLARIITNSGCYDRGNQLSCPHCGSPMSAEHALLSCTSLQEYREDAVRHLGLDAQPSFSLMRNKPTLIPTIILAAFDSLEWMLQRLPRSPDENPTETNLPILNAPVQ